MSNGRDEMIRAELMPTLTAVRLSQVSNGRDEMIGAEAEREAVLQRHLANPVASGRFLQTMMDELLRGGFSRRMAAFSGSGSPSPDRGKRSLPHSPSCRESWSRTPHTHSASRVRWPTRRSPDYCLRSSGCWQQVISASPPRVTMNSAPQTVHTNRVPVLTSGMSLASLPSPPAPRASDWSPLQEHATTRGSPAGGSRWQADDPAQHAPAPGVRPWRDSWRGGSGAVSLEHHAKAGRICPHFT